MMSDDQLLSAAVNAVVDGQADELARLLKCRPPSSNELKGFALLASESKSLPILQVLVDNGWDVNMPESYSEPPFLGRAIREGAGEEVVRWFLDHGADPNAYAKLYKVTPLSRAVQYAPLNVVQLLFDHGGSAEKGELVNFACRRPAADPATSTLLNLLYSRGAPIDNLLYENFPQLRDVTMFSGTPLWDSCGKGDIAAVRFLLAHGASALPNPSALVTSPLDEASRCGHPEIVKMLLETTAR